MARILLAEDYDDLRQMISELLVRENHQVEAFDAGDKAQEVLLAREFDLIILDWELPQVVGPDICRQFRSTGGTTPILMLTGRKAISDKETGFDAGADDYLTKPFHPRELAARVKALLKRAPVAPSNHLLGAAGLLGTVFCDRYEIISLVGSGGTGSIYKAKHLQLEKMVAVKALHPQLISDKETIARFKQEAQTASSLAHSNIVNVHDYGVTADNVPFLVMDLLDGRNLWEVFTRDGRLPMHRVLNIFLQACEGLIHSHSRGIVHRDVKPSNIMISHTAEGDEHVHLVDFGIAKIVQDGKSKHLTQTGDVLGSPLYMSPEQCMGQAIDSRTDIFSLGCVLYQSVVGSEPFAGSNIMETMYKRTVEPPRRFWEAAPDIEVPEDLEYIVFKALARNPAERYQTMEQLRNALANLL